MDEGVEDVEGVFVGFEAVEDADGEASGGEVKGVRVVVEVGEEGENVVWFQVKGGENGGEEGRGEVRGKVFDEMPLRRFDGMKN